MKKSTIEKSTIKESRIKDSVKTQISNHVIELFDSAERLLDSTEQTSINNNLIEPVEPIIINQWASMTWCSICSNFNNGICLLDQDISKVPSFVSDDEYECPELNLPC